MGDAMTAAMHVALEEGRLEALEARRAALRGQDELLAEEQRLARAGLRLWSIRAEKLKILHGANTEEEEDIPPAPKQIKLGCSLAAMEAERTALQMAKAAAAAQEQASCSERCALAAKAEGVEQEAEDEEWELHDVARRHYEAPALKVPVEMLRKIFMMLCPDDRVTAGQVCSRWRDIMKHPAVWVDAKWDKELISSSSEDDSSSDDSSKDDTSEEVVRVKLARKAKAKLRTSACRLLRAATYIDEAEFWTGKHVNCLSESLKFRKIKLCSRSGTPDFLKSFQREFTALEVTVYNHATARAIDMKCADLTELNISFMSSHPFIFRSRFVKWSSLKILICKRIPILTLQSILQGHRNTLENLTLRYPRFPDSSFELLGLQSCARLNRLQVPCCLSFRLPPSCRELELQLSRSECRSLAECRGCAALAAHPGSLTHLRLRLDENMERQVAMQLAERHFRFLRGFLAPLRGVSFRFREPLSPAEAGQLSRAAGRGLVFETI